MISLIVIRTFKSCHKTDYISAPSSLISKILISGYSAECPLCKCAKISTCELVRNAEFAKFDTRENKYIYSIQHKGFTSVFHINRTKSCAFLQVLQ